MAGSNLPKLEVLKTGMQRSAGIPEGIPSDPLLVEERQGRVPAGAHLSNPAEEVALRGCLAEQGRCKWLLEDPSS